MNYQNMYNQAVSAYLLEDFDLSRSMTDRLISDHGENALLLILSGNIHEAQKQSDKAIADYKKAIHHSPENPEAYNNLGVVYKNKGDFDKAETAFLQAAELAPDRADISYNLGNLFKKNGNLDNAETWYKKSIEQDPAYIKAYNNLGTIFELNKDYEKAEDVYRQGLSMDKNNATLHFNLGVTYQDKGNLELARSQYEESLRFRPGWTPSLGNLGDVLQNQGELDEAEKKFSMLLDKEPENVRAINSMGTIYAQKGNDDKARQFFKKALAKEPSYKTATLNLKQLYLKENSLQEALEELNKQTNYHPEDMTIRLQIASILTKQERFKEAEKVYNHILERQADCLEAYKALADLYARQMRPDLVRSCVVEIFKLDPQDRSILITLAETYYNGERFEEALDYINDYLNDDPGNKKALRIKARILQKTSHQDEASEIYESLDDDPDIVEDPRTLTDMAEAYFQSGKREKAVEKLESLVNLQGSSTETVDINQLTATLELYEKTVASFQQGSENWQNNLNKMRQITIRDMNQNESSGYTTGPRFSRIPLEEEDAVSLLDINAMEPIIKINEEEDFLYLEEDSEDMEDVYSELQAEGLIPKDEDNSTNTGDSNGGNPTDPPPYPMPMPIPFPVDASAQAPVSPPVPTANPAQTPLDPPVYPVSEPPRPPQPQEPAVSREEPPPAVTPPPMESQDEIREDYKDPLKKKKESALDIAGMMGYLFDLSHDLPEDKRQILIDKAIPLKMASVVKRLSGGEHFKEKVSSYDRRNRKRDNFDISERRMKNSLTAFKDLSQQHPDDLISSAFSKKMDQLMAKIKSYI